MLKKGLIILLSAVLSAGFTAMAEDGKDKSTIEFDKLIHDYGQVYYGADGTSTFTFTNKGKEPITLSNVRSSCGCTVPQWTREPVKKGKTGSINVRYNTRIMGSFTKTITVYSNADNSPVRLTIKGTVVKAAAKE